MSAAFLQTDESLDSEGMNVWVPAELAVLFGFGPSNPVLPLPVTKAFMDGFKHLDAGSMTCPQR